MPCQEDEEESEEEPVEMPQRALPAKPGGWRFWLGRKRRESLIKKLDFVKVFWGLGSLFALGSGFEAWFWHSFEDRSSL